MNKKELKIVLEGMPEDKGFVRVNAFISSLNAIINNISRTDKTVSESKASSFFLRITDLSYKSPATVIVEAVPNNPDIDLRDKAINKFYFPYETIQEGRPFDKVEYGLIEDMVEITKPIGKYINSITITTDGHTLNLTSEFKAKVDLLLAPEEHFSGFIRGMLEYINIHHSKNVFRIYPDIGPAKIACHFPIDLTKKAIEGVGKYVEVKGELKFKAISKYPHEIIVEEIEIFPPEEELPSLHDLRGIAPDLTGSLSSEQFVRKIRDAQVS
jgi:hypothetical protein